jgi:hypothetical protein
VACDSTEDDFDIKDEFVNCKEIGSKNGMPSTVLVACDNRSEDQVVPSMWSSLRAASLFILSPLSFKYF